MSLPPPPISQGAPLARMRGITKSFGPNVVLRGVDLDLHAGECHVLAGENGAGKSTLINILGGVVTSFEGSIEIDGRPVRPRSPLQAAQLGVAVIHQELSLVPTMSVADNLYLATSRAVGAESGGLGARLGLVSDASLRRHARQLLSRVGLEVDVETPAGQLPLARQQLIEIAKALGLDARVIVMDEPTSALPARDVERVFALIDRLKSSGCAIVYISHKMDEIERIADRITVLRDGVVVGCAPASEMPHERLIRLMVGREISRQIPYAPAAAGAVRLRVEHLSVLPASGQRNPPVSDLSLEARGGEVLGLAGLHGSGTGELLLALFGDTPRRKTRGRVAVDERAIALGSIRAAMRAGIALLTSDRKQSGLVMPMSVTANTTLADLPRFSPLGWRAGRWERQATEEQARRLNLRAPSLDAEVRTLSGGNQQKVALAKWLIREPKVLLLDEPTRGVDVGAKREIYGLINALKARGVAIIMISTELPELLGLSDRIAVMHRGRLSAMMTRHQATPEAVLAVAMGGNHATGAAASA